MKKLLVSTLLISLFVSCQKKSSEPASSGDQITSLWYFDATQGNLAIDSLEYDGQQRVVKFKALFYLTPTMAIPKNPGPGMGALYVWTFTYTGSDTLPGSYTLVSSDAPNPGVEEHHFLTFDNQGRVTSDSTPVAGDDVNGYAPTDLGQRVIYTTYNGNASYFFSKYDDLSSALDTVWMDNGNVSEWRSWTYGNYPYAASSLFRVKMRAATYSDVDNPFYRYKALSTWPVARHLFEGNTQTLCKKLQQGAIWSEPYISGDEGPIGYTWTLDNKGKVIAGLEGSGSEAIKFVFHYR